MSISIQLNSETEQRLDFLVAQTGRSKADYLQEIIENGIENLEVYYLAEEVLWCGLRTVRKKIFNA